MSIWDDDSLDLPTLAESVELECKAAQGRDGRGELPDDFWKTYSAMANTEGGVILLGVQEKPRGQFRILGLADVERVRKAIWDNLHNRKQISINLLSDADVQPVEMDGQLVLRIRFPVRPGRAGPSTLAPIRWAAPTCAGMKATTRPTMKPFAACWPSGSRAAATNAC